MQETQVRSLGQEDPLEEKMATHSSILAGRIPWTEEPGQLQSVVAESWTQLKRLSMHIACMETMNGDLPTQTFPPLTSVLNTRSLVHFKIFLNVQRIQLSAGNIYAHATYVYLFVF